MKILFCTDGSRISYYAISNFIKLVNNPIIDIICAADWSFLPDSVVIDDNEFVQKCTNSAAAILNSAENYLNDIGIDIRNKIQMCGSAVDCILETVDNGDYDVIVLGSNGKKGIQKWLGSVSQEVTGATGISTFVAKYANNNSKILFTVDYSDISKQVVEYGINNFNLSDKKIFIATVCEVQDYLFLEGNVNEDWISDVNKKQRYSAKILLEDTERIFAENGLNVYKKHILTGNPANEIIKFSSEFGIDVVVCGTRNRKYFSKILISSVSGRILEHTKSDVFIMRSNNSQ